MRDLRNLPAPVLERLADDGGAGDREMREAGLIVVQRGQLLEARSREVEVRTNDDGTVGLHGYATVYDYGYRVGGLYGWDEVIAKGACGKSVLERDDVRCLFDHDGIPVARTKSRTLTLESDDTGLLADVPSLDVAGSPYVQSLRSALDRGDLDEMSFAFRVIRQEWNGDYTERIIREVQLFDVSVVTYPANPATVVGLRDGRTLSTAEPRTSVALARAIADSYRSRGR